MNTEQTAVELLLRLAAALAVSAAWLLIVRGRYGLRPAGAWKYALVAVSFAVAWRWFIFAFAWIDDLLSAAERTSLGPWINQANQVSFTLLGIAIAALAYASRRRG